MTCNKYSKNTLTQSRCFHADVYPANNFINFIYLSQVLKPLICKLKKISWMEIMLLETKLKLN